MATSQESKQRELATYDDIKKYLGGKEVSNVIRSMIPKVVNGERLLNVTLTMIRANEKLMECTKSSLLAGIFYIAKTGLDPSLKQVHMVPFYNSQKKTMEATIIPDWRGLVALAMRSGEVKAVNARPIYKNDTFECEYGSSQYIKHSPAMTGERGEIVGFYSIATLKDGTVDFEIMTVDEVEKRMATSKTVTKDKDGNLTAKDGTPWKEWYEDMGSKTVIRHHMKHLPVAVENIEAADIPNEGGAMALDFLPPEAEKLLSGEMKGGEVKADPVALFDESIAARINPSEKLAWDTFIVETAKANDVSVNDLKIAFKDEIENVVTSFSKWLDKRKKAPEGDLAKEGAKNGFEKQGKLI